MEISSIKEVFELFDTLAKLEPHDPFIRRLMEKRSVEEIFELFDTLSKLKAHDPVIRRLREKNSLEEVFKLFDKLFYILARLEARDPVNHRPLREKYSLEEVFELFDILAKLEAHNPVTRRPTPSEIEYAESQLGCKLPPSFIRYFEEVPWHIKRDLCSTTRLSEGEPNILKCNIWLRDNTLHKYVPPNFLVVFDVEGAPVDDYSCFDSRFPDTDGEYPIAYWYPENPDYLVEPDNETGLLLEIDDLYYIAPDFPSYIYRLLQDKLEAVRKERKREIRRLKQAVARAKKK